ncbi:MAG: cysteine desulfurase [Cytophagaceae bacterium]|nr:cysteine desulfurase [Cytophagaceae bacterium]MBK9935795.1 cysteine desulfurase [Cytophagaceae bacterium]MBL0302227.1 cysteine desulfurase [Cytophagaceae bacterium]MBL0325053.1 cysteine desulfurase [Cytophagaceae bacterium]
MPERIYLDNAATTPLDPEVLQAMLPYMTEFYGNPSSIHAQGRKTKSAIEMARKSIASLLGTSPGEIFFTSCGTEADNMALIKSVENLGVKHIISSPLEHHAILHTLEYLKERFGIKITFLEHDRNGVLNLEQLEGLLENAEDTLVSLMHGNNEIGNLLDIDQVAEKCAAHKVLFHSDTVQTMGHHIFDLKNSPIDFIVGSAHKFHGPKGTGFIYINAKNRLHPLIHGGAQERNMRGGTENLYGIVGMARALEMAYQNFEQDKNHILGLKEYLKDELMKKIPGVSFNGVSGELEKSLYTVLNVSFPPHPDNEMILFKLDIEGISCSGGSACASGTNLGSHVLNALQIPEERANVRFSFSKFNTRAEVDKTIATLLQVFG